MGLLFAIAGEKRTLPEKLKRVCALVDGLTPSFKYQVILITIPGRMKNMENTLG